MVDEPMDSDSFVGSKLRITIDTEEEVEETLLQLRLSSSLSVITIHQQDSLPQPQDHQQETAIDSKKKANCFSLFYDGNQELGLPSFTENASLSGYFEKQKIDNVENKVCSFEVQEVDDDGEDNAIEVDVSFVLEADNKARLGTCLDFQEKIVVEGKSLDSEKKQFLGELEVEIFSDDDNNIVVIKELNLPFRMYLKIEVIDDTALIGTFPPSKTENGGAKDYEGSKIKGKNAKRVLGEAVKHMESTKTAELGNGSKRESKTIMYSRKELEGLRYVKVVEQRDLWRDVYNGLAADVIREYEDLASWNSDTRHHFVRKADSPAVKSVVAGRGTRNNGLNFFVH